MSAPEQPDSGGQVDALAALLDRLDKIHEVAGIVERLGRQQQQLDATVKRIAKRIFDDNKKTQEQKEEEEEAPPPVFSWLALPQEMEPEALQILTDLADWLARVYRRFPGSELPSCWMWHPWVIEELVTLWCLFEFAYHGEKPAPRLAADWLNQYRPNCVKRIAEKTRGCRLDKHPLPESNEVPLAAHLDLVAGVWAERREVPPPSGAALVDAESYDDARLDASASAARS